MKNACSDIAEELQERAVNAQSLLELITAESSGAAVSACMVLCDYIDHAADMAAGVLKDREEAARLSQEHRKGFEDWQEGALVEIWRDVDG